MTELRWILLIAGMLVIAGIYLFTRYRPSGGAGTGQEMPHRREPVLGAKPPESKSTHAEFQRSDVELRDIVESADESIDGKEELVEEPINLGHPEKIVTLRVAFSETNNVPGSGLTELFKAHSLRFGNLNIFHKFINEGGRSKGPIFSVASIVEPGSFDLANIETDTIPGLTLFMMLPNPIEGSLAFGSMLDFARAAKERFDGEVLDESGSTLSIQRAGYIRDEIIDFERKRSIRNR
ncbi:MAG: hypothetical protein OQK99_07685 [Gammaproteobacteria bacterium]|jgi:cell division protein ZipA|nr:hypothetical protein [Gammaproteobacteria bacterium]